MPSLTHDLVHRIERLPKPTNTATALIPLFEAISNAIHSVQQRFGAQVDRKGRIVVDVQKARGRRPLRIEISDNGVGLNEVNYKAFTTTDTPQKMSIGGKGVGRLLWLDCFSKISVTSVYKVGARSRKRSFDFVLAAEDQISNYSDDEIEGPPEETGMTVIFSGLRSNAYGDKFPSRLGHIFRHVTSHFLPTFIGDKSPSLTVTCGDDTRSYPDEIASVIFRSEDLHPVPTEDHGVLRIVLMECDKVVSSDQKGRHTVHFIAHDRTVQSQPIDAKLGLRYFGDQSDRVFQACVFGKFLDQNVNQERTAFKFEDATLDAIINDSCMPHIQSFLSDPLSLQRSSQAEIVEKIVEIYPSVGFGPTEELQKYVPLGENSNDAIFGHLSRQRFRRDEKQSEKIRGVLSRLKDGEVNEESFAAALHEASAHLEESERRSLAEYVVRRKVILDFLEVLLERVRLKDVDSSYQREDVLHSFICPMRVNAIGSDTTIVPASHDLWIIDERLTFAQYFASDIPFVEIAEEYASDERADVLLFDRVHGLRQSEENSNVLLVEFKRPGRTTYSDGENPQLQIQRYVKRLLSGPTELDVRGRPVRLSQDTVFYCFIIADCKGRLDEWTDSWARTADGRGRIYQPQAGFRGSIELIEWDALLKDAKDRNKAFFDSAGLHRK